jgi:Fuc2NAc and GlcNAc transferase
LEQASARLFMGDAGSTALGFIIMLLALLGEKEYGIPAVLWCVLYGGFLFDASVTLIRRMLAREVWYSAHNSHAYQRLYQGGWSHRQIFLGLVSLYFLAALSIFGFFYREYIFLVVILTIIFLAYLYMKIEKFKPMFGTRVQTHEV